MIGRLCSSRGFILSPPFPLWILPYQNPLLLATLICVILISFPTCSLFARFVCYFRTHVFRCISRSYVDRVILLCVQRTHQASAHAAIGIFTAFCGQNADKCCDLQVILSIAKSPINLFCVAFTRLSTNLRVWRACAGMDNALYQAKQREEERK